MGWKDLFTIVSTPADPRTQAETPVAFRTGTLITKRHVGRVIKSNAAGKVQVAYIEDGRRKTAWIKIDLLDVTTEVDLVKHGGDPNGEDGDHVPTKHLPLLGGSRIQANCTYANRNGKVCEKQTTIIRGQTKVADARCANHFGK